MPAFLLPRALTAAALTAIGGRRFLSSCGPPALELPTGLFGCLTVSAPGRALEVASLDPSQHADIGKVVVPDPAEAPGLRSERRGEWDWLVETPSGGRRPLRVMVPVPMDLRLTCGLGCSLSVVENRSIEISSASPGNPGANNSDEELFSCRFDRVKSDQVRVTSETGRASLELSRTLLGSLAARACNGLTMTASMYQGKEITLESSQGRVAVETNAVYCRQFSLSGAQASLHCGSAHGDFSLEASDTGSVKLDSLEGSLQARMLYGDVTLHLTRPGQVSVEIGEGSVSLGLQRELQAESSAATSSGFLLDVTASGIDLDEELGRLLAGAVFPMGANAVRLVAQLPGDFVVAEAAAECRVRVLNGRVRIASQRESGVFAGMVARSSHTTAASREK